MSDWPCPDPEFPWNPVAGWYERCTRCGRVAWEHEQADPLADVRNTVDDMRRRAAIPSPPVMKP